jgi:hypothetical protein
MAIPSRHLLAGGGDLGFAATSFKAAQGRGSAEWFGEDLTDRWATQEGSVEIEDDQAVRPNHPEWCWES